MGTKDSKPRRDFPSFRKRYYVRENRGVAVVSKWPRSRPGRRHPTSEWWSEWLKQANILFYALPEVFKGPIRTAGRGWPQMPRDLAIASMRGTLWSYTTTDGITRYPMAAATKLSETLDILAPLQGMMLQRGPTIWQPVQPGTASGQVLTWDDALTEAKWMPASGGGFYSPPSVGDFTIGVNVAGVTWVNAPTSPAVLHRPSPAAANTLNAQLKSLPAPSKTYIVGCQFSGTTSTDSGPCFVIRDSTTGEIVAFSVNKTTLAGTFEIMVEHWNSPTSFNAEVVQRVLLHEGPMFLRIEDNGTNFIFTASAEADGWLSFHSESRTAFLTTPDQIGLGFRNRGFDVNDSMASFIHWSEL